MENKKFNFEANDFLKFIELLKLEIHERPDVQKKLRLHFENTVGKEAHELAMLSYHLMAITNDWYGMGEQRVALSFARLLLDIESEREVNQFDANLFRRRIDTDFELRGKPTALQIRNQIRQSTIKFPGYHPPFSMINDEDNINEILEILGSENYLFVGYKTSKIKHLALIWGRINRLPLAGSSDRFRKIPLLLYEKELVRTPVWVLSLAGSMYSRTAVLRYESLDTLYHNKWRDAYDDLEIHELVFGLDASIDLRDGIKAMALRKGGILTASDALQKQAYLIQAMLDPLIWHEIGHKITLDYGPLPEKYGRLGSNISGMTANAFYAYSEALAEFAPMLPEDGVYGSVKYICTVAKNDMARANLLVYMLLSDYYFYEPEGNENSTFTTLSELVIPLVTNFIDDGGNVSFQALEDSISSIAAVLYRNVHVWTQRLERVLENATFTINGVTLTYQEFSQYSLSVYRRMGGQTYATKTDQEILSFGGYWTNLYLMSEKYSPELCRNIDAFIESNHDLMIRQVLSEVCTHYNPALSLKDFVFTELARIGCRMEHRGMNGIETPDVDGQPLEVVILNDLKSFAAKRNLKVGQVRYLKGFLNKVRKSFLPPRVTFTNNYSIIIDFLQFVLAKNCLHENYSEDGYFFGATLNAFEETSSAANATHSEHTFAIDWAWLREMYR